MVDCLTVDLEELAQIQRKGMANWFKELDKGAGCKVAECSQ
jgi:hypothetical protein